MKSHLRNYISIDIPSHHPMTTILPIHHHRHSLSLYTILPSFRLFGSSITISDLKTCITISDLNPITPITLLMSSTITWISINLYVQHGPALYNHQESKWTFTMNYLNYLIKIVSLILQSHQNTITWFKMLCLKCERYMADKSKVTNNIVDVLGYMDLLKRHEDSAQKDSKLRMMKRHLNSNNRVLKDLNAILNYDCQTCERRG